MSQRVGNCGTSLLLSDVIKSFWGYEVAELALSFQFRVPKKRLWFPIYVDFFQYSRETFFHVLFVERILKLHVLEG